MIKLSVVIGVILTVIALVFVLHKQDERQKAEWHQFTIDHQCKVTAKMQGSSSTSYSMGNSVTANGQSTVTLIPVTTTIPSKTAWLCNDGITYWRNGR